MSINWPSWSKSDVMRLTLSNFFIVILTGSIPHSLVRITSLIPCNWGLISENCLVLFQSNLAALLKFSSSEFFLHHSSNGWVRRRIVYYCTVMHKNHEKKIIVIDSCNHFLKYILRLSHGVMEVSHGGRAEDSFIYYRRNMMGLLVIHHIWNAAGHVYFCFCI